MEGHHQILVVKYKKEPDIILNIENVSMSKYPIQACAELCHGKGRCRRGTSKLFKT